MFTETPTKMKIAMRKISLKEIHERGAAFWSEDEPWLELQVRIWSGAHNAWWRSGGNNVTNTLAEAWILPFGDAYNLVKDSGPGRQIVFHEAPKRIEKEVAYALALPRWPQCKISGKPVTREQALDILMKTDLFFTHISENASGNNKAWIAWAHRAIGYDKIFERFPEAHKLSEAEYGSFREFVDELADALGLVPLGYLANDWASSSEVVGPNGWCNPNGTIAYIDNVGKKPTVLELHEEFEAIATAFPYLDLTATVMNGSSAEPDIEPVITFIVKRGRVTMTDEHEMHHHDVVWPDRADEHLDMIFQSLLSLRPMDGAPSPEQGIPNEDIEKIGEKTKPVIERLLGET